MSADYFRLFGARTIRGRTFTPQEDLPNGDKVVVLSDGFWKRRFAADPAIIGKTISLGGDPYMVIGIIAPDFDFRDFGLPPDVWVPFQLDPHPTDQGHYFQAAGRLKPGVTMAQANAQAEALGRGFPSEVPERVGEEPGLRRGAASARLWSATFAPPSWSCWAR